jgi:hypothetical protein
MRVIFSVWPDTEVAVDTKYPTRFEDFTVAKIKIVTLAILLQIVLLVITGVSEESNAAFFFFTAENVDSRFCQMFIAIWETQRNLNIPLQIFENCRLQSIVYETNVPAPLCQ